MTWKVKTGHFNLADYRTFELGLDKQTAAAGEKTPAHGRDGSALTRPA